jgi:acyl-CoA synthetase (NDP forming)
VPAIAGLRTGLACAAALRRPPADPARLREIARAASPSPPLDGSRASAEHAAKQLLREAGVAVVDGRLAATEDDAVRILDELGPPVALKLSAPSLLHKTELGALALGLKSSAEVREAHRRLAALALEDAAVLVERMADPGLELLVAARRDAVVPALVVGLGGMWTEIHDDVAIVPLPASPERVERALRSLRGAPLLTGSRGRTPLDVAAVAGLASSAGDLLVDRDLSLIELNPVLVYERGAVAVDAVVR